MRTLFLLSLHSQHKQKYKNTKTQKQIQYEYFSMRIECTRYDNKG